MTRPTPVILAGLALALAILACRVGPSRSASPTPPAATAAAATSTPPPVPSDTPAATVAAASPTEAQATIPPFLTSVPGIAATLTAVFSTPGAEGTLAAQQTEAAATEAVLAPQLSGDLLSQCPHPSDPPMQNWANVPVMPQATAGQIVRTLVGAYYCFRAPVTAQDVDAFYKQQLAAPQWMVGSDTNGTMMFIGMSQAGAQLVTIASGPGDQNDLIVALNVTRPIGVPTP